jgi:alkaline phosphatase
MLIPHTGQDVTDQAPGCDDVAIYASGPKAHLVRGVMEQNWIYHVMKLVAIANSGFTWIDSRQRLHGS